MQTPLPAAADQREEETVPASNVHEVRLRRQALQRLRELPARGGVVLLAAAQVGVEPGGTGNPGIEMAESAVGTLQPSDLGQPGRELAENGDLELTLYFPPGQPPGCVRVRLPRWRRKGDSGSRSPARQAGSGVGLGFPWERDGVDENRNPVSVVPSMRAPSRAHHQ